MAKRKKKPETPAPKQPETFGEKLTALRLSLHLTQEQAAERLEIPLSTYRNWEQDRVYPRNAALALIKNLLGKIE